MTLKFPIVKYPPKFRRRHQFDRGVGKIPWRRAWQPTPVFLPGESHGQRSLGGYSPWGRQSVVHDLAAKQQNSEGGCSLKCHQVIYPPSPISRGSPRVEMRWDPREPLVPPCLPHQPFPSLSPFCSLSVLAQKPSGSLLGASHMELQCWL